jgi:hypothetical protein
VVLGCRALVSAEEGRDAMISFLCFRDMFQIEPVSLLMLFRAAAPLFMAHALNFWDPRESVRSRDPCR